MQKAKEKQKERNERGGKKMENKRKYQKGITLIALVITIIVLLILVAVSIATLTGENGILTKANEAKDKTQIEDVKEQARLDILAEQMENEGGSLSDKKLKEILDKYFEKVPEADELEGKLKDENGFKLNSKPEYGGQEVDIGEIYDGDLVKEPLTVEQIEEKLKDNQKVQYVTNYGIDIDKDGKSEDDWEIFYIEDYEGEVGEDGVKLKEQPTATGKRIFLIASDYVKVRKESTDKTTEETDEENTPIIKSRDKAHMESSSTEEYKDYCLSWSSPEYHCTLPSEGTNEKPACTFPKLFKFSQYNIKANAISNINSMCASTLLCTENWSSFANDWADYATGGSSVEMWVDSWNKRYLDNKSVKTGSTGYAIGIHTTVNGKTDPLYFPHTSDTGDFDGDGTDETCYGYWVASPSSAYTSFVVYARYDGRVEYNKYNNDTFGIRPIVCLKSNVKLVKSNETITNDRLTEAGMEAECYELVN